MRAYEWQVVQRRRPERRKDRGGIDTRFDKEWGTFFFRNFPESCPTEELRRRFGAFGKVEDVFVPEKRDKQGKKFGFVRFSSQRSPNRTLTELNNIWIGSHIIRAYIPKYGRRKEYGADEAYGKNSRGVGRNQERSVQKPSRRIEGRSYSEVLVGKVGSMGAKKTEGEREVWLENSIQFQSTEAEGTWLKGAFTGRLKGDFLWKEHGEELQSECAGSLKLTDMGSNMVLVQSISKRSTEETLKGFDEWVHFWMDWMRPWTYTDANQRRLVWTRWIGVPLQAWSLRFFCLGCSKFGSMVELHEITKNRRRLDEAYILISTGIGSVDRIVKCNIDGAWFQIRIEEVRCMDKEFHLVQMGEDFSDLDSDNDGREEMEDAESVEAMMLAGPGHNAGGESSMNDATVDSPPKVAEGGASGIFSSGIQKGVTCNYDGGALDCLEGPEKGGNQNVPFQIDSVRGVGTRDQTEGRCEIGGPNIEENTLEPSPIEMGRELQPNPGVGLTSQSQSPFNEIRSVERTPSKLNQGNDYAEEETLNSSNLGETNKVARNGEPTGGRERSPLRHRGEKRRQSKEKVKGKEVRAVEWEEFIGDMASGGERDGAGKTKKKGKWERKKSNGMRGREGEGVECWNFGKKLGLSTKGGDVAVIQQLEKEGMAQQRLGEKEDIFK